MKCNNRGITGNPDVAALYATKDMQQRMANHRGAVDAKSQHRGVPFIAQRNEVQKGQRVTRTIVVVALTAAEALPRLKRLAKEYYLTHTAPWIINNGDSFYS